MTTSVALHFVYSATQSTPRERKRNACIPDTHAHPCRLVQDDHQVARTTELQRHPELPCTLDVNPELGLLTHLIGAGPYERCTAPHLCQLSVRPITTIAILHFPERGLTVTLLILPDQDVSSETRFHLTSVSETTLASYPSKRPWIIGTKEPIIRIQNRQLDVVLVGRRGITDKTLESLIGDASSVDQLDSVANKIVEFDALLIARDLNNMMRIYAPPFQTRSVFWLKKDGTIFISDEQYPLALLSGFEIDLGVLTSRIANAEVSHPFINLSIWKSVECLGTGESITIGKESVRRSNWWIPPEASRSSADLKDVLAEGITEACALRVQNRDIVSSDLSGGLDSTTLCFYLAEQNVELNTIFMDANNELNNDWRWAKRASQEVCSIHYTLPYRDVINDIINNVPANVKYFPEGPSTTATATASVVPLQQIIQNTGSGLHFNGHAGDALFGRVSSSPWSFVHSNAKNKYKWLRQYRAISRIPIAAMIKMLTDKRSFESELKNLSQGRPKSSNTDHSDHSSWIQVPQFSAAFTPEAIKYFNNLVETSIDSGVGPFCSDRSIHQIICYLTVQGIAVRRMNLTPAHGDIYYDSPYLDKRIVEPALALNHEERTRQKPIKPLLAKVRPTSMSLDYFQRQDKGDYTMETISHYEKILSSAKKMFENGSKLAELGIIKDSEVMRMTDTYSADGAVYADIIDLEFAERWLRSVESMKNNQNRGADKLCYE